jgi:hypothetical protein
MCPQIRTQSEVDSDTEQVEDLVLAFLFKWSELREGSLLTPLIRHGHSVFGFWIQRDSDPFERLARGSGESN